VVKHLWYGFFGNAFRLTAGDSFLVFSLLPLNATAAPQGCNPKVVAASTAPDAVAHYQMTMSAALAASIPAQVELAGLYLRGHGVKPDLVHAYAWLNLAAAKRTSAAKQREELEICLDSADRLKEQLLSVKLLARIGGR
jgi:TPR repeat protein